MEPKFNMGSYNIKDILYFDHSYLKECIEILKEEDGDAQEKLEFAKIFLDKLQHHSEAEKKTVYALLKDQEEFHDFILEGEIEHAIVDSKVKMLMPKIKNVNKLEDELKAEMKVLAELVEHHIEEEENELIPKLDKLDEDILNEIGMEFIKLRQFNENEMADYPPLLEVKSRGTMKGSPHFRDKIEKYLQDQKH